MGFLEKLKESISDRVQAVNLKSSLFWSSGNPFVDILGTPGIGELTEVDLRKGTAKVIFPMNEPVKFPARKVRPLNESALEE